jgi:hypothetical protein
MAVESIHTQDRSTFLQIFLEIGTPTHATYDRPP